MELKNRIVMPPMVCFGFAGGDGLVTPKNIEHYEARAKGGAGLIVVEATCVHPEGRLSPNQLGLWADEQIEGFHKLANVCHQFGAKIMVQLHSAGLMVSKGVNLSPVAPSNYTGTSRMGGKISARELTLPEISSIQGYFEAAAIRAKAAGLDGVELHGAHGYLISQFFSPRVNQRQDRYGGNLDSRTRFASEIIGKIRAAVGPDFIISCRIGCNEPDLDSSIRIAQNLEAAGLDLLHVSTGLDTGPGVEQVPFPVPDGFSFNWVVYGGTEIKKKVKIPIIAVNGIRTPEQADYLIEKNLADLAAIGKGLLVNPDWANQAQEHLEVSTCLDCKVCAYFRPGGVCPAVKKKQKAETAG